MEKNYMVKSTVREEYLKSIEKVDNEINYLQDRIKEIKAQQKRFEVKVLKQDIKKKRIEGKMEQLSEEFLDEEVMVEDKIALDYWLNEVTNILQLLTPQERVEYCKKWKIDIIAFFYEKNGKEIDNKF